MSIVIAPLLRDRQSSSIRPYKANYMFLVRIIFGKMTRACAFFSIFVEVKDMYPKSVTNRDLRQLFMRPNTMGAQTLEW